MYFHTAAYGASLGSVTNADVAAGLDDVLQRRNNHLIMSERFNLIAAYGGSSTLTRARFGNVALTFRGSNHIWPLERSDTVPDNPIVIDRRDEPLRLPMNEEITIEATTDAIGPIAANFVLWLAKPQWNRNLPFGSEKLVTRATATVAAGTETTWSPLAPLVFERDLFNGVYAVTGAQVVAANAIAFRLFFPSMPQTEGRSLRPGGLVTNALGNEPWMPQMGGLGEWGRFHTFEPPSIQTFADSAGGAYEVRLALTYLGENESLLYGG